MKDKILQIRISAEDYENLREAAKQRDTNVSAMVRESILKYMTSKLLNVETDELYKEIESVEKNLEIAKARIGRVKKKLR